MEKRITKCKGCGMPIFFLRGKPWYARKVPIVVEKSLSVNEYNGKLEEIADFITTGYVSHFINCPKAKEFSKEKKHD